MIEDIEDEVEEEDFSTVDGSSSSSPTEQDPYDLVIGFRPTGWAFNKNIPFEEYTHKSRKIRIVHIPYSEHSSFSELQDFVKVCNPVDVIPTVTCG